MADTRPTPPNGEEIARETELNAYGHQVEVIWQRRADPALEADRYGAGRGVYLDPAEQRAAQATAELLFRIRRAAGERVALMAKARRSGVVRPRRAGGAA